MNNMKSLFNRVKSAAILAWSASRRHKDWIVVYPGGKQSHPMTFKDANFIAYFNQVALVQHMGTGRQVYPVDPEALKDV